MLLTALTIPLAAFAGQLSPVVGTQVHAADLARVLDASGTFHGRDGVTGTVAADTWRLVSDTSAGEPPRFQPTGDAPAQDLIHWPHAIVISGTDLYVGGRHTDAAGIPEADYIAKWDGRAWSALGSNGAGDGALNHWVNALVISNGILYVGGWFANAAGIPEADYVAKWDGRAWSALGSNGAGDGALSCAVCGSNWGVEALAAAGEDLYVGGYFNDAAGIAAADRIARWDGQQWSALGSDARGNGVITGTGHVGAIVVSGTDVFAGGQFLNLAGLPEADSIAKWDGNAWSALGSNGRGGGPLDSQVSTLAMVGSDLYAGGIFDNAGGSLAEGVARWDGARWSALGTGLPSSMGHSVGALAFASGDLYVGASLGVARWDGSQWSTVLTQFDRVIQVTDIAVAGEVLYVAGNYGGGGIGRWDGTTWGPLVPGELPVKVTSPFYLSLPTPSQISFDPIIIAQTLLITAGLLLLIPFPSTLFNNTLEAHYDEIVGRVRNARRRASRPLAVLWRRLRTTRGLTPASNAGGEVETAADGQPAERDFWRTFRGISAFLLLSALLSCLLDPTLGFDLGALATFAGMVVGLAVLQVVSMMPPTVAYIRSRARFYYRALPGTFVVAIVCVVISRWADFQPGYLYGMIIGTITAAELGRVGEGRTAAVGAAVMLGLAVVAWFALGALAGSAAGTAAPPLADIALMTALTTVVVGGVVGTAFSLLPITYMPGGKIKAWRPPVLVVLGGLAALFFLHVILNPANGYLASSTHFETVLILLALFIGASVGLWAYFRLRRQPAPVTTNA